MSKAAQKGPKLEPRTHQAEKDTALLAGVASGKEEALESLYDEYAPMLLALSMKILRSITDTEEVVQELFQDVWRNASAGIDGTVHARMVASARERSLSRLRARGHRKQHHAFDPATVVLFPDQAVPSAVRSERDEIISALKSMGKEGQQLLALAFYEGFTESEIADIVHRPAPEVRKLLNVALMLLHRITPWSDASAPPHENVTRDVYASGALKILDPDNAREFEAHLALPCEGCKAYLRDLQETTALLPTVLVPMAVPPDLKGRILFSVRLSRIAEEDITVQESVEEETPPAAPTAPEPRAEGARSRWLIVGGVFLVLVILVGLAAYVNTLIEKVGAQYAFIQSQQDELSALKSELSGKRGIFSVLDSPQLELVRLKGLPAGSASRGNFFWDAGSNRAILQVSHLPQPTDEIEYRLRIVLKDKSILRSGLTAATGPDSMKTYLAVDPLPAGFYDRLELISVVRVNKDADADEAGEIFLQGAPGPSGSSQRTK